MDKMGREGGGGQRYVMPQFEDGSSYGPGDEFYEWVASTFSPQQWNNMPDEGRVALLDGYFENRDVKKIEPNIAYEPTATRVPMDDIFAQFDLGVANASRGSQGHVPMIPGGMSMEGLFGGGEEGPVNAPIPQQLPTPSPDGTPTSALIGEFMRGRIR